MSLRSRRFTPVRLRTSRRTQALGLALLLLAGGAGCRSLPRDADSFQPVVGGVPQPANYDPRQGTPQQAAPQMAAPQMAAPQQSPIQQAAFNRPAANGGGPLHFHKPRVVYDVPREFDKVSMPEHVIEPPDILRLLVLKVLPKGPYQVEAQDDIFIQAAGVLREEPINNVFSVDLEGKINLGVNYGGKLRVAGLTVDQIAAEVVDFLKTKGSIRDPNLRVTVSIVRSKFLQQISGEHLVEPDGAISLGNYGRVRVVGLTVHQAKEAVEAHLSKELQSPEVAVGIAAFNSKVFYVIFDGAGRGQQIVRLPITGNDTVLDAISQVYGLTPVSSKNNIWVARPSPANMGQELLLPVDWVGVTTKGLSATNYQLLAGDRLYVESNSLIRADTKLAQIFAPIERLLGLSLLGTETVRSIKETEAAPGGVAGNSVLGITTAVR